MKRIFTNVILLFLANSLLGQPVEYNSTQTYTHSTLCYIAPYGSTPIYFALATSTGKYPPENPLYWIDLDERSNFVEFGKFYYDKDTNSYIKDSKKNTITLGNLVVSDPKKGFSRNWLRVEDNRNVFSTAPNIFAGPDSIEGILHETGNGEYTGYIRTLTYGFSHWSGDASGSNPETLVTINNESKIIANYIQIPFAENSSVFARSGWFHSSWFGHFFTVDRQWLYHENLGWVYYGSGDSDGTWIYISEGKLGWSWTSKDTFPKFYNPTLKWIYFNLEEKTLYNYANKTWISLD